MSFHTKIDYQYKLLFLGETSVGKTSLFIRFTEDKFIQEGMPTLGVDVKYKYVTLEDKKIRLDLWDTAGQERFKNITKNYLQGANGIFFVCDVTNKETFNKLKFWFTETKDKITPDTEMIIVGNKIDLIEKRVVKLEALKELGKKFNIDVFEVSAKTGEGVEEIFISLTKKLLQNKNIGAVLEGEDENTMRRGSYILSQKPKKNNKNGNGCNC